MATRLYLPVSGTPPLVALAVNSNWELINNLARLPSFIAKQNTALTTYTYLWPATATQQWCWRQYQSQVLKYAYNWTTADTASMVIGKCAETTTGGDTHLAYVVRVVSGDGTVIRGVIGLFHAISSEYPLIASAATRIHNVRTDGATNFSSQAGDRIIVEIGLHGVTPVAENIQMRFGDPSATADFALTAGLTTDLCPWVQLSRTVEFGTLLVVQDTTQAQVTENAALVTHSFLTSANMTQAQTAENLALISRSVLMVGDVAQAQVVDNLTLVYHEGASSTPLVIQDMAQTQEMETPILTAHSFLSVSDMVQAQNTDNQSLLAHSFLTVNNTVQAQNTDNVSLTAHSFLSVANIEQAQAVDNLALQGHSFLSIANVSQGQAVDGLSLTARSSLSVADVLQGQGTDGSVLVTHSFLNIANTSQNQATDNLALVSRSSLAIADLSQGQVTDAPLLVTHSFLTVANATQGQVTENMVLAYHPAGSMVLVIQDTEQGQVIDQPSLVSHSFLSIANLSQSQAVDSFALLVHSFLTIANILQGQATDNMALVYHPVNPQTPPSSDTFRGMYLGEFLNMKRQ